MDVAVDDPEVEFVLFQTHQLNLAMRAGDALEQQLSLTEEDIVIREAVPASWSMLFGKAMRDICDVDNIAVETTAERWPEFQQRVIGHLAELKYCLSERVGRDIGWEQTCAVVRMRRVLADAERVIWEALLPYANNEGICAMETIELPREGLSTGALGDQKVAVSLPQVTVPDIASAL